MHENGHGFLSFFSLCYYYWDSYYFQYPYLISYSNIICALSGLDSNPNIVMLYNMSSNITMGEDKRVCPVFLLALS